MAALEQRQERLKLYNEMRSMVEEHGGKFSPEQQERFNKLEAEEHALAQDIERRENLDRIQKEVNEPAAEERAKKAFEDKKRPDRVTDRDKEMALRAWVAPKRATREQLAAADKCGINLNNPEMSFRFSAKAPRSVDEIDSWLTRATTASQAIGTTTVGNELQITETKAAVEKQLLAFGGVRQVAQVVRTRNGGPINWPTMDDTGNKAGIIGENTAVATSGMEFSSKQLTSFKFGTGWIKTSWEFLNDSAVPMPGFIGEVLGERMARGLNTHFTAGAAAHSSGPAGVASEATIGVTPTTGTSHVTYENLVKLMHSVDPAYRANGTWMFHDSVLRELKQLTDSTTRPLWLPSVAGGQPDTILGKRYIVNQDMATDTTATGGVKLVLFGDFSKFVVRDVMDFKISRADELFLAEAQVAWVGHSRHDSLTISKTTSNWPIQAIVTPAT